MEGDALELRYEEVQVVNFGDLLDEVGQRGHELLRREVVQDIHVEPVFAACQEGGAVCATGREPNNLAKVTYARMSRRTTASTSGRG